MADNEKLADSLEAAFPDGLTTGARLDRYSFERILAALRTEAKTLPADDVVDQPCDLCAGECRGHSLGHPAEWEPEPGSRAALSQPAKLPDDVREVLRTPAGAERFLAAFDPEYAGEDMPYQSRAHERLHDALDTLLKGDAA